MENVAVCSEDTAASILTVTKPEQTAKMQNLHGQGQLNLLLVKSHHRFQNIILPKIFFFLAGTMS